MAERFFRALAALSVALCFALPCAAQDPVRSSPTEIARARERWARLTPAQKVEARERYERYLALSEEGRAELRARAERLRAARESLARRLPSDVREALSGLGAEKRRELVGELFEAEAKERGRELKGRMPEDLLERLRHARPEERPELLRRFQDQQRGRVARALIGSLGPRSGLSAEEVARLQELPLEERLQAARELGRAAAGVVSEGEEPFGLAPDAWRRLSELPPEEFLEGVRAHRERRLRELREPAPGPGARSVPLARLAQALRPDPREALELAALARGERHAELSRRRRARCLEIVRAGEILPAERVRELEGLDDAAFFGLMRALAEPSAAAERRPRPPEAPRGARPAGRVD